MNFTSLQIIFEIIKTNLKSANDSKQILMWLAFLGGFFIFLKQF